jgi:2-dehydro-3-deoxyphosphooctonate aldolase (KDO 8-P synthase)
MTMVDVAGIEVSNSKPFVLFGGMNVLESEALALEVAQHYKEVCARLDIPLVFKASFDKANRSSVNSFRGPGMATGLEWLAKVKSQTGLAVITDVHEIAQVEPVAEVADVLQLPAFLSRQTDLVRAMAGTGKPINIKKAQFLAAHEMQHIIKKCQDCGNEQIILCERGTSFGYNNLVVDMLNLGIMKRLNVPVIFDVTHALQLPGGLANAAGGRRAATLELGKAGVSQGIAGIFLEAHPDPDHAKCDGPSALPLDKLEMFLSQLKEIDQLVKKQAVLDLES